jgi:hypothetical protein
VEQSGLFLPRKVIYNNKKYNKHCAQKCISGTIPSHIKEYLQNGQDSDLEKAQHRCVFTIQAVYSKQYIVFWDKSFQFFTAPFFPRDLSFPQFVKSLFTPTFNFECPSFYQSYFLIYLAFN